MNANEGRELGFLDVLNVLSCILQVESYNELMSQASSDDIYQELRKQDRRYLDRILKNQTEILKRLDRLESVLLPD